jgi:ATP-dependent protease HslVU (ClpYQ) ATPase subunit
MDRVNALMQKALILSLGSDIVKQGKIDAYRAEAEEAAEERILDVLLPRARNTWGEPETTETDSNTRQIFRKKFVRAIASSNAGASTVP